jgi:hypothetical protein
MASAHGRVPQRHVAIVRLTPDLIWQPIVETSLALSESKWFRMKRLTTSWRLACGWLILAGSSLARAQVKGELALVRTHVRIGEPVELIFTFTNTASKPIEISMTDPYSQCSPYRIAGVPRLAPSRNLHSKPTEFDGLEQIECLFGGKTLTPREQYIEHFRIDRRYDFSHPGTYSFEVTRSVAYDPNDRLLLGHQHASIARFQKRFIVTVRAPVKPK